MNLRTSLPFLAFVCVYCGPSFAAEKRASQPPAVNLPHPNILLILADDLGYADHGCQGSPDVRTPHIDSLAANGLRCTAGYVTAPQCSPSRAGLLSGRYQQQFGHEGNPNFPEQGQLQ